MEVPAGCGGQTHTVSMQILHRTPLVGCQTSAAAIPWASGIERYKRSAAYAALRCRPWTIGGVHVPFTTHEGFDRSDVDSLREEFAVRFFLVDHRRLISPGCAHVREAVSVLERSHTMGGDGVWTVIDTGPLAGSASG
jgi:hypothetical protein